MSEISSNSVNQHNTDSKQSPSQLGTNEELKKKTTYNNKNTPKSNVKRYIIIGSSIFAALLVVVIIAVIIVFATRDSDSKTETSTPTQEIGEQAALVMNTDVAYKSSRATTTTGTSISATTTDPNLSLTTDANLQSTTNEKLNQQRSRVNGLAPGPVDNPYYFLNRTIQSGSINMNNGSVKVANYYLDNMNRSADPCSDFYEFACGRQAESHLLKPNEQGSMVSIALRRKKFFADALFTYKSSSTAVKSAKIFMKKCLDASANRRSAKNKNNVRRSLTQLIDDFLLESDIPFISGGKGSKFNVEGSFKVSTKYDSSALIHTSANRYQVRYQGLQIALKRKLFVRSPLVTDGNYTVQSELFKKIKKKIENGITAMLKLKNITKTDKDIKSWTRNIIQFDLGLHTYLSREENKSANVEMAKLIADYGELPLKYIMNEYKWNGIIITTPSHLKALNKLIQKAAKPSIANYIAVITFIMWQEKLEQYDCYRELKKNFIPAISHLFEITFPSAQYRKKAKTMSDHIAEAMREILNKATWISDETRRRALVKLNATSTCIGFHDTFLDQAKVDASQIKIEERESWPVIAQRVAFADNKKMMEAAGHFFDRAEYCQYIDSTIMQAVHFLSLNLQYIFSGFLQFPIVDYGLPESVLYGILGVVIGHELTHGYDPSGRKYGPSGMRANWWTPEDDKNFAQKAECLVNWMNNYTDPLTGLHENGTLTLGENIADLGGIKSAYMAYRYFVNANGKPKPIPGFEEFTDEQTLFISSTQFFCNQVPESSIGSRIKKDSHALNRARVSNIVTNTEEFAKIFNCPVGAPHNPTSKRCSVW